MKKRIVVFTGAGVSADSGIATFRDSDGLWANYRIEEVCTPEALAHNRKQVVEFYNMRRREVLSKEPNEAHKALVRLEPYFDTTIITQNIDDLHERAGSSKVIHLHGEIRKLCSSKDVSHTLLLDGWEQKQETRHNDGSLLRPFVVFFGESVPMMDDAIEITESADLFVVIGTSLAVYPAASLLHYVAPKTPIYYVDPKANVLPTQGKKVEYIAERGAIGVPRLVSRLIEEEEKRLK